MDTSNHWLTITVSGEDGTTAGVGIVRNGSAIEVYSGELPPGAGTPVNCGASPTVTTVDSVWVYKPYHPELNMDLTLSIAGGDFAPGFTAEGSGASEIEFDLWADRDDRFTLLAGQGNDMIRLGEDRYSPSANLNPAAELAAPDADIDLDTDPEVDVFTDGRFPAAGGNDEFTATGATSEFSGPYQGEFSVYGGPGDDRLSSTDWQSGPVLYVYETLLAGGPGDDELVGGMSDLFMPGTGNDIAAGTPAQGFGIPFGSNTVSYADSPAGVVVNLSASGPQDTVGAGVDTLSGISSVQGSARGDVLIGPDASGWLVGDPPGAEGGDDVLVQMGGLDYMEGGGGTDTASFQSSSQPVDVHLGEEGQPGSFTRPAGIESVVGSPFDDVITGNDDANQIIGLAGRDSIAGRGGADYVDVVDGERDDVSCGEPSPGDTVVADSRSLDLIGPDCEDVSVAFPSPPDTKPPKTTISDKPRKRSRKRKVRFEFKASEDGSVFECRIDAEPFAPCTTPSLFRLDRGSHRLLVRAKDLAGNVDPTPASFRFTLR
ncbi:MAG TPA: calcium-binding protein [Solirubrobacterales bacterium]|nr:calcium-binding protein [Solirubrobacterales bacterium]